MPDQIETATFAGGCFWCVEAVFRALKGVENVVSGYTGGTVVNPSYHDVCSGDTGHAEAVQVTFHPDVISFDELLDIFWQIHDPTTLNRQGADFGTQYRSAIFYHDSNQREKAEKSLRRAEDTRMWPDPIVTEIVEMAIFYPAEIYHQDYYGMNPFQPYCRLAIEPKIRKLQNRFSDKLKPRSK